MNADDLLRLIQDDPWMMKALEIVRRAALPDVWVVAGFVRHKVWDVLHGYEQRTFPSDIDVVFFDPGSPAKRDRDIEEQLSAWAPEYPWEVYNQAHMHTYNDDPPYTDTVDAFCRWAESVSTIGVRLSSEGRLELAAPHGIDDLVNMVIRPTPHPAADREVFERRLRSKGWLDQWPKARVQRDD